MTACFLSQIIYIQHEQAGSDLANRCAIEKARVQNQCLRLDGFRQ